MPLYVSCHRAYQLRNSPCFLTLCDPEPSAFSQEMTEAANRICTMLRSRLFHKVGKPHTISLRILRVGLIPIIDLAVTCVMDRQRYTLLSEQLKENDDLLSL